MEATLGPDELNWDVVVLGTGLQETYLAWQLSSAGKSVLQIDSHPFYGGPQATLSLTELEELASLTPAIPSPISELRVTKSETKPPTKPGRYNIALAPSLIYPTSSLYKALDKDRRGQIYTWGAVDAFYTYIPPDYDRRTSNGQNAAGGIQNALATAVIKGKRWNKGRRKASSSTNTPLPAAAAESDPLDQETPSQSPATPAPTPVFPPFRLVPSSEEAIAFSPHLTDPERATMALFLRTMTSPTPPSPSTLTESLPLRPALISQIATLMLTHSPPDAITTDKVQKQLSMHAKSLGIITNVPSAAALTLGYGGLGELCQDWSRLVAVAGGTNILSRRADAVEEKEGEGVKIRLSSGEEVQAGWVVGSGYEFPDVNVQGGEVLQRAVYVINDTLPDLFKHRDAGDDDIPAAAVIFFPADSLEGNSHPIYVSARDSGTSDCPAGECVLYISTLGSSADNSRAKDAVIRNWKSGVNNPVEAIWTAEWRQVVGTESRIDGRRVLVGELSGDLVVGEGVMERLDGWVGSILGTFGKADEGEGKSENPEAV